jgi:CheY-like chemotaxis protein
VSTSTPMTQLRSTRFNGPPIRLPKRDGFELMRDIRALGAENGGNVPVIAMTAYGAARDRTIAAGFQAHLDKPFDPDQLLEVIKSILRR